MSRKKRWFLLIVIAFVLVGGMVVVLILGNRDNHSGQGSIFENDTENKLPSVSEITDDIASVKGNEEVTSNQDGSPTYQGRSVYVKGQEVGPLDYQYLTDEERKEAVKNGDLTFYTMKSYSFMDETAFNKLYDMKDMVFFAESIAKQELEKGYKRDYLLIMTLTFNEDGSPNYFYVDGVDKKGKEERHYYGLEGHDYFDLKMIKADPKICSSYTEEEIKNAQEKAANYVTMEDLIP